MGKKLHARKSIETARYGDKTARKKEALAQAICLEKQ